MAQGRFCVGMLHYEILSETGRVVHVYDSSFPWKESVSVDIPETVSYNGKNYTVIAIGANAFASRCSLQAIKIPNSVTKIGKYAFWGCDSLRSVQIPNSVTEIGANAFLGCHLLRTVRIPNSVTVIGDGAFAGCRSLSAVGIPNSVTEIGRGAFEGCHSLRTVRIPSSVAKIGDRAFFNCRSLQSITVDAGNAKYKSINGVLFNREATLLMSYPLGKKQQVYKIPNGVKVIGEHAFRNNSYLREVMMSDSVTTIGLYAFPIAVRCEKCQCRTLSILLETMSLKIVFRCRKSKYPVPSERLGTVRFVVAPLCKPSMWLPAMRAISRWTAYCLTIRGLY